MTEEAYFNSLASADAFKALGVERYEFVATLDEHTCELCQPMDGKVFKLSERMVGVTAPPIHPNCRCVTVPWYDDAELLEGADEEFRKNLEGGRAARDTGSGKTIDVPGKMTYGEWKEKYVDAKSNSILPNAPKSAIIKGTARDIKDAVKQSRLYANFVSYKGVQNIDSVNEINGTLDYLQSTYKGNKLEEIETLRNTEALASANFRGFYPRAHFLNDPVGTVADATVNWTAKTAAAQQSWSSYLQQVQRDISNTTDVGRLRQLRTEEQKAKKVLADIAERLKYTRHNVIYAGHEVRSVVTHEYAHMLADQSFGHTNGARANPAFANDVNNPLYKRGKLVKDTFDAAVANGDMYKISMYAAKNEKEFLAEAFTMYDMGVETLPGYIEKMIEEVFDL
jgi:hypothetical protein